MLPSRTNGLHFTKTRLKYFTLSDSETFDHFVEILMQSQLSVLIHESKLKGTFRHI